MTKKNNLHTLRTQHGLTQEEVARTLGMTRPTYVALEHGKRELSLQEAQKAARLFGLDIDAFADGVTPRYTKYKQMIIAFLRVGATDGRVPKTKLAKLLYLADFAWFYKHLCSMSGMRYIRREYGPVPNAYFRALEELEQEGKINIERKGDALLVALGAGAAKDIPSELSKDERALVGAIAHKWQHKRTQEIVAFTHAQLPYAICKPDEAIPYELITQEESEHVF